MERNARRVFLFRRRLVMKCPCLTNGVRRRRQISKRWRRRKNVRYHVAHLHPIYLNRGFFVFLGSDTEMWGAGEGDVERQKKRWGETSGEIGVEGREYDKKTQNKFEDTPACCTSAILLQQSPLGPLSGTVVCVRVRPEARVYIRTRACVRE